MTPEPQSNDAPVSGVPLSVIIDTLRERLKATRADLEQAKRDRDKLATVIAQAEEAASSSDVVGAIRYNWKAFQKQAQLLERYRDGLASITKGRDAALAQADALRLVCEEIAGEVEPFLNVATPSGKPLEPSLPTAVREMLSDLRSKADALRKERDSALAKSFDFRNDAENLRADVAALCDDRDKTVEALIVADQRADALRKERDGLLETALRPCFRVLRKWSPGSSIKPHEEEVFAALDAVRAALRDTAAPQQPAPDAS